MAKNQDEELDEVPQKQVDTKPVVPKVLTDADKKRSQDLLSAFTECMSALSSNKISTRNAFEVGLIDNLDEVVHMSGDSDEDEIKDDDIEDDDVTDSSKKQVSKLSFTRASKAIEGASRLYGYRVEAIYDQTFNVLASMNTANNLGDDQGDNQREKVKKKRTNFSDANKTLLSEKDVTMDVIPVNEGILDPYFL